MRIEETLIGKFLISMCVLCKGCYLLVESIAQRGGQAQQTFTEHEKVRECFDFDQKVLEHCRRMPNMNFFVKQGGQICLTFGEHES